MGANTGGCQDELDTNVDSVGVAAMEDPAWPYDAEDLEVNAMPAILRSMVGLGNERTGTATIQDRLNRSRLKPRMQSKGIATFPTPSQNFQPNRRHIGITDLNRRINDLKMEGSQNKGQTDLQTKNQISTQVPIRRDSNSTVSSYYGSMKSSDMSRKSSIASQVSAVRPAIGSFYDPISAGSSRRSSQLSTGTTGGTAIHPNALQNNQNHTMSVPPAPPSQLLASHLQRLQSNGNLVLQVGQGRHYS